MITRERTKDSQYQLTRIEIQFTNTVVIVSSKVYPLMIKQQQYRFDPLMS